MTLTIKIPNVDRAKANLIIAWDKFYKTSPYEISMAKPAPMKHWQKMWLQKSDFVFICRQVLQHQLLTPQRGGQPNRKNFTFLISHPLFIMFGIIMIWNHDIWPKIVFFIERQTFAKRSNWSRQKGNLSIGLQCESKGAVAKAEASQAGEPFWRALVSGDQSLPTF